MVWGLGIHRMQPPQRLLLRVMVVSRLSGAEHIRQVPLGMKVYDSGLGFRGAELRFKAMSPSVCCRV
jgi:hypothetical protein